MADEGLAHRSQQLHPAHYGHDTIPLAVSRNEKRATLLGGICADGHALKPLLILQRETMEAELLNSGYTKDKVQWGRSSTGFMNTGLFLQWARLSFFPELQRRRMDQDYYGPALLLLDGFGVHHVTYNPEERDRRVPKKWDRLPIQR